MSELLPRATYHRGAKVMITEDYISRPKMSLEVCIPKGSVLEVIETLFIEEYNPEVAIRCRNYTLCKSFDFCVPESLVVPLTNIDRLLYG